MPVDPVVSLDATPSDADAFAAFTADEVTAQTIVRAARAQGWPVEAVQDGGLAAAARTLAVLPPPRLLILDISDSDQPIADLGALDELLQDGTTIIAIGTLNDVGLYRRLIAADVSDYLVKPLSTEALDAAIADVQRADARVPATARAGRIAAVVGARGGVGASTIAANVAWLLAHDFEKQTALVDLDLQFGICPLLFDLDGGHGLRETLEQPERLDELFLERAMVRESERLFVLGTEEGLDDEPRFEAVGLNLLLDVLQGRFGRLVIDLPRHGLATGAPAIEQASDIILVTELSLASLRDCNRLIRLFHDRAPDARLLVTANRALGRTKDPLPTRAFERALDAPLAHLIPFDEKAAAKSQNVGQPIPRVGHARRTVKVLRRLAGELAEPAQAAHGKTARKATAREAAK